MVLRAALFDAYGTLLDVHPMLTLAEQLFPGQGQALMQLWREKQTEYTRMIVASERAGSSSRETSFRDLTVAALRLSAARLGLPLGAEQEQALIKQQRQHTACAGAAEVLQRLFALGLVCGTFGQDDPDPLAVALKAAGLSAWLGPSVSMRGKLRFRNDPQAWGQAVEVLDMPASDILFVSADHALAAAASWFGYVGVWLQYGRDPPDAFTLPPSHCCDALPDLLALAERRLGTAELHQQPELAPEAAPAGLVTPGDADSDMSGDVGRDTGHEPGSNKAHATGGDVVSNIGHETANKPGPGNRPESYFS